MLPRRLLDLKNQLEKKGIVKRSTLEDRILEELTEVDKALDAAKRRDTHLIEGVEKYAMYDSVLGPAPGACPTCGRAW